MRVKDKWVRQKVVHALKETQPDPVYEVGLARHLSDSMGKSGVAELYGRFGTGTSAFDAMMRRVIWRALAKRCGDGLTVETGDISPPRTHRDRQWRPFWRHVLSARPLRQQLPNR